MPSALMCDQVTKQYRVSRQVSLPETPPALVRYDETNNYVALNRHQPPQPFPFRRFNHESAVRRV